MIRSVEEIANNYISLIVNYFLTSGPEFLKGLGVDIKKLPEKNEWIKIISDDLGKPVESKKFFYLIWQIDTMPVGHSDISNIIFGEEAYMHLHIWYPENRKKGDGTFFITKSVEYYFQKFKLKKLFCQPYALNPAPNRTLEKAGFQFMKT